MKAHHDLNTYLDWSEIDPREPRLATLKWLTIIVSSIIVGVVATSIDISAVALSDLRSGSCQDLSSSYSWLRPFSSCTRWKLYSELWLDSSSLVTTLFVNWPLYLILSATFGLAAAIIAIKKPLIVHSGIPEISLVIAGFNYSLPAFLSLSTTLLKAAGLVLAVASGLWLGKEGPMVHVACGIFSSVYSALSIYLFRSPPSEHVRRELLEAAAAAGMALAFNSPLGGVLFILEAMPSYLVPARAMWSLFVAATISLIVLVVFKVFARGPLLQEVPLFDVDFGGVSWLLFETVPFILLGVAGGFYGFAYISVNSWLTTSGVRPAFQRRLCSLSRVPSQYGSYLEILLMLVISSICTFMFAFGRLPLNDAVKMLFADCVLPDTDSAAPPSNYVCAYLSVSLAFVLVFTASAGFVLSSWAYAADLPGGVLMPSLAIGACTGRFVGLVARYLQPMLATCSSDSCIVSPSSYAVVGAAAFFTGISKLTVLVVIIIFEMTGAVSYVLPIMLLVMVAKFTNDWLCLDNIYQLWLRSNFNRSIPPSSAPLGDWAHPSNPPTNYNKGTGRVLFMALSQVAKCAVPDVSTGRIMIPIARARCLYIFPSNSKPIVYKDLFDFAHQDPHEGWPLLYSPNQPQCLGYIRKAELRAQLASLDIVDDQTPVSLQCADHVSNPLASAQIELTPHQFSLVVNDQLPLVTLLEMFEKLHLNNLVVFSSIPGHRQDASGLVDRFMLAKMIQDEFRGLRDAQSSNPSVPSVIVEDYDMDSPSQDVASRLL